MFTQEALENFISKNVDEILTEASNHLKESLEKEVKLLMEELEEYKLKFKRLNLDNSNKKDHQSSVFLRDSGDSSISESSHKEKLSIDTGKVEIQERVKTNFFKSCLNFFYYFLLFFINFNLIF